ncbi:MAG: vWA domain-containing protein [Planctomycetota bacterium]
MKLRPSVLFPLAALVFGACGSKSRALAPAQPAPDTRISPITQFRIDDWNLAATDGAEQPRTDNGRLRLESINPTGPNPTASIASRIAGQYSDFGARIHLARANSPTDPADYAAFLTLDILGTTEASGDGTQSANSTQANKVGTLARIGLRATGSVLDLVSQVLDASGNPIEQKITQIGVIDGDGGTSLPAARDVRLELDQQQQVLRFYSSGQLELIYVPTTLAFPENSKLGVIGTGRKFLAFVEDFLAIDVGSAVPTFSYEQCLLAPASTSPGRVQFLFTLRDQADQILNLPNDQIAGSNLFFAEAGEAIDRAEANPLFKKANLVQDVVIVLDYSESLRSQGGIAQMVAGAKDLATGIWNLNSGNRIQFWEFHDSSTPAAVVPGLPAGAQGNWLDVTKRAAAFAAIDAFAPYNGFSRVFDAVVAAATAFNQLPIGRQSLRSVCFLTDGFDTGSVNNADSLIATANGGNFALYPIAVGSAPPQLRALRRIAALTRGNVYPVPEVAELTTAFGELSGDLGSLYSASYVSSRDDGPNGSTKVNLNLDLLIPGATDRQRLPVPVTANIDILAGDTRVGQLDVVQATFSGTTATLMAKATFVPRLVDEFPIGNFTVTGTGISPGTVTVTTRKVATGLLKDWTEFTRTNGVDRATAPAGQPLQFGDFGDFFEITLTGIPATTNTVTLVSRIVNADLAPVRFQTVQPQVVGQPDWTFSVLLNRPPATP